MSRSALKKRFSRDVILGPISWTLALWMFAAVFSWLLSALLAQVSLWLFTNEYLTQNPVSGIIRHLLWLTLFVLSILPTWQEKTEMVNGKVVTSFKLETFTVPGPAKGAQLVWIGIVTPIVLSTGKYYSLGGWLGFGWLQIESKTISDGNGFLLLGDVTFQVWQTPAAETKEGQTTITLQAGNGATVSGNLSLVLTGRHRIEWEKASDSGLQLGNRARQELQEVLERFVDTDVKSLQGVIGRLLIGNTMLTCMLPRELDSHKKRSLIRDVNGHPIYLFVEDHASVEQATAELRKKVRTTGESESVKILPVDAAGDIIVASVGVSQPITDVIEERGFALKEVIYDSIRASQVVEDASNKASSEAKQRDAQLASARTNKAVREALAPSEDELNDPNYALRLVLAAAQDNPEAAQVVHLAGGDELTRSVVAANLVTGEKK